ncbi:MULTISPECIES: carbohydrate ABC transporter permease [Fervidobacterium]|uniref:Binding-protein-dependent transport systems inner membrane component n=1 Tax=Fervidobacterium nodosum (strain ATCC 35602 / DSM 5306 / Rt17-B1) TaxID=381764 RepID=A7HK28_FERNB|nr:MULTISPECIES: carbohydrate ABC transporter permease [Fervidobacterium]ABS60261.1 binding-protein-dependent transport systems inner membrane component [Fervidobacterium nodosum Rt17-B1]
MKELRKLFIYILLIFGTVVMIAPFAWMLVTSFKLPSEVNSWPPRWSTKSFSTQRDVKVVPSTGTTSSVKGLSLREALTFVAKKTQGLVLVVNDDPFYRGTLTIPFKGSTYTLSLNQEEYKQFLQSLKIPSDFSIDDEIENNPEGFFEKVLLNYIYGATPVFKRTDFIERLSGNVETLLNGIDTMLTFGIDRIQDENEKEKFANFLEKKMKELQELSTKIQKYKAGNEVILTIDELKEIRNIISNYNLVYENSNELSENYNNALQNSLLNYLDNINFFLSTYDYFVKIQDKKVDENIVAQPMTEEERKALLLEKIKDLEDFEDIKSFVDKHGMNNLIDEFAKSIDLEIERKYGVNSVDLANIKSLVNSIVNIATERQINIKEELKNSFEDFLNKVSSVVGFDLTFSSAKAKLDAFSEELNNADNLLKEVALNIIKLQNLRMAYEGSINAWKIIRAPEFVESVLVKDGKSIEIVMKNVSPVYFMDDNIKNIHLKFSFSDVVKNVFQNYVLAWKSAPFGRYYINTIFIATVTTILEVIISAMAAYAFSWMNFPGKNILFSIFLATMMVPGEVLLVPNFITVTKFGWIDTYYALIIPWIVSVFSIFLMRQHFLSLPSELFDAAKIDGCSHWRYLWQIVVPLSKPVVVTSALLKFVGSWNSFLWVLIVTNSPKYRTLTVGLQTFSSEVGTLYNMLMAAATFSILPVVIIFLFTQKYFVRGIARTGLK